MTQAAIDKPTSLTSEYDRPERKRGARIMFIEVIPGAITLAVFQNLLAPFAVWLGASTFQMGVYSGAVELTCASAQLRAAHFVKWCGGRKRMLMTIILLGALPFLLLAAVPWLPAEYRVWTMIALSALGVALFLLGDGPWGSWISDMVPAFRRGKYLGMRGSLATLVAVGVGVGAAFSLDILGDAAVWGFVMAFVVATAARLISAAMFTQVVDPRPGMRLKPAVSLYGQFAKMGQSVLGRYNLFILIFHIGMGSSVPFIAVYMLRDLEVSYTVFVGLGVIMNIAVMAAMPLFGRIADRKGNLHVLWLSTPGMATWPLVFLVSGNIWFLLVMFIQVGIFTAAWNLATFNFVLEQSDLEERPAALGSFRAMASLGTFIGAVGGGIIASRLPEIFEFQVLTLLLIAGLFRGLAVAVFLPRVMGRPVHLTAPT
ncbi:MAG: MFS transporter [SAR202 cluster bacterium]|nr:MFS transporter [SAR202 cluster bacterium]